MVMSRSKQRFIKSTIAFLGLCSALYLWSAEVSAQTPGNQNRGSGGEYGKIEHILRPTRVTTFRKDRSGNFVEAEKPRKKGDPADKIGRLKTNTRPALRSRQGPEGAALSLGLAALPTACTSTSGSLINPKFETADSAGLAKGWCDVGDFGYSRVQVTPTKYNYVVQLSIPPGTPANPNDAPRAAVGQDVALNQTSFRNVFVGGMVKGSGIPGEWGAFLQADFQLNDGTVVTCISDLANLGSFDWRWIGLNADDCLNPDQPIKRVTVSAVVQDGGTAYFDLMQLRQPNPGSGAMTFLFDDGLISVATIAKPYLDAAGLRGSAAVITGATGTAGHMSNQDLNSLKAAGWDIISHSVTHPWFPALSDADANTELGQSKATLRGAGFPVQDFAWPFGGTDGRVTALAQSVYTSTRRYDVWDDNGYGTFPYNTKGYGVLREDLFAEPDEFLGWMQGWIEEAKLKGRWAILTFHDLGPLNDPDNDFINSPEFFAKVVDMVKASGINVVNYIQGRQMFANVPKP